MGELNVANRTLAIMDNLPFLRSLNNECIDLIAIDPPFAANETFTSRPRPPITENEIAEEKALAKRHGASHNEGIGETRVKDVWNWDEDIHPAWKMQIEDDYPSVHAVIQAVEACARENEAAYIAFMAVRLIECRRVLKPTGSIYVHCDSHANSYLRMLMDAVFGKDNFRNEIVWDYSFRLMDLPNFFNRKHDTLLFYAKGKDAKFSMPKTEWTREEIIRTRKQKVHVDENGEEWIWMPGGRGNSKSRLKRIADIIREGKAVSDVWSIPIISSSAKERTGYVTQKPLVLYERIIKASSNPGDVVLDIFAGCATTAIAA